MYKPILCFDLDETLVDKNSHLYPQISKILNKLHDWDYTLWMISFRKRAHAVQSLSDLLPLFDAVLCDYHHGGKVTMIKNLCEQHRVLLENCILFDDNNSNIQPFQAAGGIGILVDPIVGLTSKNVGLGLDRFKNVGIKPIKSLVVGSKNEWKIYAAKAVFYEHYIFGINVESGVPSQPIGWEETALGSKNRLLASQREWQEADAWLGIENGLVLMDKETNTWCDVPVISYASSANTAKIIVVTGAGVPTSFKGPEDLARYQKEISAVDNRACEYFTGTGVCRSQLMVQALQIAKCSVNC